MANDDSSESEKPAALGALEVLPGPGELEVTGERVAPRLSFEAGTIEAAVQPPVVELLSATRGGLTDAGASTSADARNGSHQEVKERGRAGVRHGFMLYLLTELINTRRLNSLQ